MVFEPSFAHTEKGMRARLVLVILNRQYTCPLAFLHRFEEIRAVMVLHNYEFMVILRKSLTLCLMPRKRDGLLGLTNRLKLFSDDLP